MADISGSFTVLDVVWLADVVMSVTYLPHLHSVGSKWCWGLLIRDCVLASFYSKLFRVKKCCRGFWWNQKTAGALSLKKICCKPERALKRVIRATTFTKARSTREKFWWKMVSSCLKLCLQIKRAERFYAGYCPFAFKVMLYDLKCLVYPFTVGVMWLQISWLHLHIEHRNSRCCSRILSMGLSYSFSGSWQGESPALTDEEGPKTSQRTGKYGAFLFQKESNTCRVLWKSVWVKRGGICSSAEPQTA